MPNYINPDGSAYSNYSGGAVGSGFNGGVQPNLATKPGVLGGAAQAINDAIGSFTPGFNGSAGGISGGNFTPTPSPTMQLIPMPQPVPQPVADPNYVAPMGNVAPGNFPGFNTPSGYVTAASPAGQALAAASNQGIGQGGGFGNPGDPRDPRRIIRNPGIGGPGPGAGGLGGGMLGSLMGGNPRLADFISRMRERQGLGQQLFGGGIRPAPGEGIGSIIPRGGGFTRPPVPGGGELTRPPVLSRPFQRPTEPIGVSDRPIPAGY